MLNVNGFIRNHVILMPIIKAVFKTNPLNAKIKIPLCSQKHSVWCRSVNPFSREHSTLMRNYSRGFQETLHSKPKKIISIQKILYSCKRLKKSCKKLFFTQRDWSSLSETAWLDDKRWEHFLSWILYGHQNQARKQKKNAFQHVNKKSNYKKTIFVDRKNLLSD